MSWRVIASTLLLCTAVPCAAQAEDLELFKPAGRQGYFLGGGLRSAPGMIHDVGLGFLGYMPGLGLTLRGGQVVNDVLGFGLVLTTRGGANSNWTGGFGALSLEGQYMPITDENLAFRAAIGVAGLSVNRVEETEKRKTDPEGNVGTLYTLGMSYDWFAFREPKDRESGGFAFTVFAEAYALPAGDLFAFGAMLGIEITYWFGFDASRLDLTPDEAFDAPPAPAPTPK